MDPVGEKKSAACSLKDQAALCSVRRPGRAGRDPGPTLLRASENASRYGCLLLQGRPSSSDVLLRARRLRDRNRALLGADVLEQHAAVSQDLLGEAIARGLHHLWICHRRTSWQNLDRGRNHERTRGAFNDDFGAAMVVILAVVIAIAIPAACDRGRCAPGARMTRHNDGRLLVAHLGAPSPRTA